MKIKIPEKPEWLRKHLMYGRCEACGSNGFLSPHHRHRQIYYKSKKNPHMDIYWDKKQILVLCNRCHSKMPPGSLNSKKLFIERRGEE